MKIFAEIDQSTRAILSQHFDMVDDPKDPSINVYVIMSLKNIFCIFTLKTTSIILYKDYKKEKKGLSHESIDKLLKILTEIKIEFLS